MPKNYDDNGDDYSGIVIVKKDDIDKWGFKVTYTLKYNSLGDVIDAYVTGGLYSYLLKRQRH